MIFSILLKLTSIICSKIFSLEPHNFLLSQLILPFLLFHRHTALFSVSCLLLRLFSQLQRSLSSSFISVLLLPLPTDISSIFKKKGKYLRGYNFSSEESWWVFFGWSPCPDMFHDQCHITSWSYSYGVSMFPISSAILAFDYIFSKKVALNPCSIVLLLCGHGLC